MLMKKKIIGLAMLVMINFFIWLFIAMNLNLINEIKSIEKKKIELFESMGKNKIN